MTRTLDKSRPYGQIFGNLDDGSVFEQDGCRFNGRGECVYEPKSKGATEAIAPVAKASGTIGVKPTQPEDRRAKLEALHASVIAKLVEDEGMTPAKGPGSKARNIEQLLADG